MKAPRLAVPVLMLHHVEPDPAVLEPRPYYPDSYLSRRDLAALLDDLAACGLATWTLSAAVERQLAGQPVPRRSVVLTFDDGCRCFRDHALPELVGRGMTATLFAVSGELGGSNRWDRRSLEPGERREELLGAFALRELVAAGIEVGAHSRRHVDLTQCSERELADEVAGSREELALALGQPVKTFCYPYGACDARVMAAVAAAGYLAGAGIDRHGGAHGGELLALARQVIRPGESRFERRLKSRGLYPLWSRLPRVGILRRLRRPPS